MTQNQSLGNTPTLDKTETRFRVRSNDPTTSIDAAEMAALFAGAHKHRIMAAIERNKTATADEIATLTGLTVVQVDRRMIELKRDGAVTVVPCGDGDLVRNGYRVWALPKNLSGEEQTVATATNS